MTRSRPISLEPEPTTRAEPSPSDAPAPIRLWRRFSLRRQMAYGFAIPVLIVLLASFYVASVMGSLREAARNSVESTSAIGMRYALLNLVVDSETGLRGYLISGDPEFLEPYTGGLTALDRLSKALEVTDAPEPAHIRKLRAVETLYKRWRTDFAEPLIALRRVTPVGISRRIEQLIALASSAQTPAQHRAYELTREQLQLDIARQPAGTHGSAVMGLLDRLAPGAAPDAKTLVALKASSLALEADEARITAIIQSKGGKRIVDHIRALVGASLQDEAQEQRQAVENATALDDRARWVARLAPAASLIVGLLIVLALLLDAIRAIGDTTRAAEAVAGGDLEKRVDVAREDELGHLGQAFNRMAGELADDRRRSLALDRFQTLLTTSNSTTELFEVVARMCTESFDGVSGAIYRIAASRNIAERVTCWNWPAGASGGVMQPESCRALRSGQPYLAGRGRLEVPCRHTDELGLPVAISMCLPLAAQGEIMGVLQLCRFGETAMPASERNAATAVFIGEQFSMALANLQLREQLRNQSIRDPLTGLFNRRYLEETMARELARCARNGQSLAIAAIDVDHFKRFNDTYGHEAGDRVLVELAAVMRGSVRTTDIACRYGGEEFVLLMPDSSIDTAVERAHALCEKVRAMRVRVGATELEPATISIGVAVAPRDGDRADLLLRNADMALYRAKAQGRDRVVVHHSLDDTLDDPVSAVLPPAAV